MSGVPSVVQSSLGRTFHLKNQIGKGGEGAVYDTTEAADIAVKLYWQNKAAQSRRAKISAMASAQWYKTTPFVAFPIDALFSPSGVFVGYVMKKITGSKPVHMLYSPASRKVDFPEVNYKFLVHAACNIARAVASVHTTGCVIGDINHSGFLISKQATSILIDSDSFQVTSGNNKFLCQVGTPEYTPPELQGARFDHITRTPNHDNFGVAVLMFQLLFMGRHPFAGRYQGSGDMPIPRAIHDYRFAYSPQISLTKMAPPPGAPLLTDFPYPIAQAFEQSFGRTGITLRTKCSEWVQLLESLENELVQCSADPSHHHDVLVVEDEALLRCSIADSLRQAGYTVIETASGEDAIALSKSDRSIDIVFTDISLIGAATGWDVAECFRADRPKVSVLYTSGKSMDRGRCVPGSAFLAKPYLHHAVVNACDRLRTK